jgi:hypothetical protein
VNGYGDAEVLVGRWLEVQLAGPPAVKVWMDPNLPSTWRFDAPIIHVQRGQSASTLALSLDDALLDVDVYAANAGHARKTAADVWALIALKLPHVTFDNGIFVQKAETVLAPIWGPDPKVYRRTATYRVILHGFTH